MTPQQILLISVVAIVVLTGGLGAALAFAARFFSREVSGVQPPASRASAATAAPVAPPPAAQPAKRAVPIQRRAAGLGAVLFAVVIIAAGVGVGLYARLMPVEASVEAGRVDVLFSSMLGIAATIFLLVEGLLLYSAFRFRRKKGDQGDGPPIHGSNRLELAWTIVPAVIVIWLGFYSVQVLGQLQTPHIDAMIVEVTARQFQWQFHYPDSGVVSSDLHLPQGKPIRLKIKTEDVIHSFWVPAFRVKQDAMPGRDNFTNFTATATGEFPIVCAELCGAGHAQMGLSSKVVVQSQADYDAWIAAQVGSQPSDPRVTLFVSTYGCAGCHTLGAANASGQIGPNLDGIGTNGASRVPGLSAADYIRQSILDPNAVIAPQCPSGACPSGVMPQDFGTRMPPADLDALVSFLSEQK